MIHKRLGEPGTPANAIFFGVVGLAVIGAAWARLTAQGMAYAMIAAAIAQAAAGFVALAADGVSVFVLNAVFVVLWLVSAALFRRAARQPPSPLPSR